METINAEIRALLAKGAEAEQADDDAVALQLYKDALDLAKRSDAILYVDHCYSRIGLFYMVRGQYGLALDHFYPALSILEEEGGPLEETSMVTFHIGWIYGRMKRYHDAVDLFEYALEHFTRTSNVKGVALASINLGDCLLNLGDFSEAQPLLSRAADLFHQLGDIPSAGMAYTSLGPTCASLHEWDAARPYLQEARRIFEDTGDLLNKGRCLSVFALIAHATKRYKAAISYYEQALESFTEAQDAQQERNTLKRMGEMYLAWGREQDALLAFERALNFSEFE